LNEFYQIAFRKKLHKSLDESQADVDQGIEYYTKGSPHSGKYCFGKTPGQTFLASIQFAEDKVSETKFPMTKHRRLSDIVLTTTLCPNLQHK